MRENEFCIAAGVAHTYKIKLASENMVCLLLCVVASLRHSTYFSCEYFFVPFLIASAEKAFEYSRNEHGIDTERDTHTKLLDFRFELATGPVRKKQRKITFTFFF